ncbi:hypothetical protein [Paenibacillus xylanexedens]|uniref:hypothetical protein n=1 Tax=Paenibacillus xylanexedens TaxID=528191 RepID=UPI00119D1E75|nr:hypothetical protein [Paenibacillus xylanexedens]
MKRHVVFGSVVAAIILLWGASWYFVPKLYDAQSLEAGTFGDMFGAVNALFSGLAFAGLIYTITVQRQELTLQREAIKMQTEELKLQREETARSADQLEGQKKLLNLQTALSVVNDLIQVKNKRLEDLLKFIKKEYFVFKIRDLLVENENEDNIITEDALFLQSYLNLFFFVLNFIQTYDLENEQKDMLSNLVSMNTTDDELELIYVAVGQNQHRLMMLKVQGFYPRHKKIIENNAKLPSV